MATVHERAIHHMTLFHQSRNSLKRKIQEQRDQRAEHSLLQRRQSRNKLNEEWLAEQKTRGVAEKNVKQTAKFTGNFTPKSRLEETAAALQQAPINSHTAPRRQAEAKAKQIWIRSSTGGLHDRISRQIKHKMRRRQHGPHPRKLDFRKACWKKQL